MTPTNDWLDDLTVVFEEPVEDIRADGSQIVKTTTGKLTDEAKQAIQQKHQQDLIEARIDELERLTLNEDMTPEWLINRISRLQAQAHKGETTMTEEAIMELEFPYSDHLLAHKEAKGGDDGNV